MSPVALQSLRHPSENLRTLSVVSADLHAPAEGEFHRCLKRDIIQTDGDGQSPLAQLERAVRVTPLPGAAREERESPPQSALVAQRLDEGLGLTGVIDALLPLAERQEGAAGVEVEVDRSLLRLRLLREMPERVERLLETGRRLPISRARRRLKSGLAEKGDRFFPRLAPERVVGQSLHVLREPLGVEAFDGLDESGRGGCAGAPAGDCRRPPHG